ncbi:VOC family protein [Micromonospora sp. WMMD1120]|uniref:VOC family protein n=1 Tax=Micromonospora sp. WMMD1120 TaxID=3016106 RepID=UPI002416E23B|nr:VOC family protein [Micromonospora sp. WMMD1120]MDG4811220.1 VOC family protein [Micromonospora sp. WMMD1120]
MIAQFKDLCLDATDPLALGGFWARVLDGDVADAGDDDTRVDPRSARSDAESIWVNKVPEPRVGRTRVHLDLRLADADPAALLAAGARLVREPDGDEARWVLTDPEGNSFCALPGGADTTPGPVALVVDAIDPIAQATWWAGVLGGDVEHGSTDSSVLGAANFPWHLWLFDAVSTPKTVKNRLHWDVELVDPEPMALIAAGATLLREPLDEARWWWVLADPEGNEFCAFAPRRTG